jgi:drug/metabolite transporter (DMT)-like permease
VTGRVTTRRGPALATAGLLAVTAVWGSTFFLIKDVLLTLPVLDFLAVRFLLAAVALALLAPRAVRALPPDQRRKGVALGLVYGVAQILQTAGLEHTAASVSGFVTGMYVVFTPLLAAAVLRQRVGRATWAAVVLSAGGLAVLSLRGFAVGYGEALTLCSAALYAVHILALGAWSSPRYAVGLSVVQMTAIGTLCTVAAFPGGIALPRDGGGWLALGYTALFAAAGALLVQTWAQAHLPATRAAVIMTMEPVFAAGFAVLFGGEQPTARMVAGGALVLAAMYLVELAPRRAPIETDPLPR